MPQPQLKTVDLEGKVADIREVHFLRAEWMRAAARTVLIRYSAFGTEQKLGLRLDLDKKVLLDRPHHAGASPITDAEMSDRTEAIWNIVANARAKDRAFSP
jgi:hypothetical protein